MIGLEVVKCINCFLDVRRSALPHRQAQEEEKGISQDDYGMFEMDFEDPALNAMLGLEATDATTTEQDQMRTRDRVFAEVRLLPFSLAQNPRLFCSMLTFGSRSSSKPASRRPSFVSSPIPSSQTTPSAEDRRWGIEAHTLSKSSSAGLAV
jgi:hypothetical protein